MRGTAHVSSKSPRSNGQKVKRFVFADAYHKQESQLLGRVWLRALGPTRSVRCINWVFDRLGCMRFLARTKLKAVPSQAEGERPIRPFFVS